jgi:hypothetical protein
MMGDCLRLGRGALGLVAQDFGSAAMQRLAAALEQAVIGRVLNQRVLEAIVRLRAGALCDEEVFERRPHSSHDRPRAAGVRNPSLCATQSRSPSRTRIDSS